MTDAHPSDIDPAADLDQGTDLPAGLPMTPDDERWQVDPAVVDTEDDPVRKQVLGVVQELALPCTDEDVASVATDLDPEAVRQALRDLAGRRLEVVEQDGGLTVTAVLHPED